MVSFNTTVRQMTKMSQQKMTQMFQQKKQIPWSSISDIKN